jgi:4-carboxymuconolactone decarboxylase
MSAPRVAPLEPPYEPRVEAALQAMMPRQSPVPPLRLFRTLAVHPSLAEAMHALGRFVLGRELHLGLRQRELVIDRICARCGCDYEWGVHAAVFADRAGLSPQQVEATARVGAGDRVWAEDDAVLLGAVDELHERGALSDERWAQLARRWSPTQCMEILLIAGWYHAIAYLANGLRIEPEEWAPRLPRE